MNYTWNGMSVISYKGAIEQFDHNREVYLLFNDNSECLAHDISDIERHFVYGGEFGYYG